MKTLDDAPAIEVHDLTIGDGRPAALQGLLASTWLAKTSMGGVVLGHHHVQALLADRRLTSSLVQFIELQGVTEGVLHRRMSGTLLALEGRDHTRVRALVRKAFVPSAVERHRPMMRDVLSRLLAPLLPDGRCELMADVAERYPIQVICHVLGVPGADHELFVRWSNDIAWTLSGTLLAHFDEAEAAMRALDEYTGDLIAARRAHPADDLVTELVQAEEAGDRLSDDELRSLIIGLLFAGHDTTRNQLGLAVWTFTRHPDQWALLADHPELAAPAVEECLRFQSAVPSAPRLVAETMEIDGYRLTPGTLLFLSTVSANHDPAAFAQPDTFDITATRGPQLTFGGGPHH
jgi:cytochrome P450